MMGIARQFASVAEEEDVLRDAVSLLMPRAPSADPTHVTLDKKGHPVTTPDRPLINALEVMLAAATPSAIGGEEESPKEADPKEESSGKEVEVSTAACKPRKLRALTMVADHALRLLKESDGPHDLYSRGVTARELLDGKSDLALRQRANDELALCSFKPEISEKSSTMVQSKIPNGFYAEGLAWRQAMKKKMAKKIKKEVDDKAEEDEETYRKFSLSKKNAKIAKQRKDRIVHEFKEAKQQYLESLQRQQDAEDDDAEYEEDEEDDGGYPEEGYYYRDGVGGDTEYSSPPSRRESTPRRPPVTLDPKDVIPGATKPPQLWDSKLPLPPAQFGFTPTVNMTSSAIHEGRVHQGSKAKSVQSRLVSDAADRHQKKLEDEKSFSKEAFAAILREQTPAKSPRDIAEMVDRLQVKDSPQNQDTPRSRVPFQAEDFSFRPEIHASPKQADPLELEELLNDLEISSNRVRSRRQAAEVQLQTSQGKIGLNPATRYHEDLPPITEDQLNTFLLRNKLYQLEKEAKVKTQLEVDRTKEMAECSFTPRITNYPLSETLYAVPIPSATNSSGSQPPRDRKSTSRGQMDRSSVGSGSLQSSMQSSGSLRRKRPSANPTHHDPVSTKVFVSGDTPCRETLQQEHYSFVHDPEFKEEFRTWFAQLDPDRCGWISPVEAWGAVKELGSQLGVNPQYVDVEGEFPRRLHFTDFVLLISRAIRMPSMSERR